MATNLTAPPTRMELIKLKRRIDLAQRGHDLLREKMDALVMEFFDVLRRIQDSKRVAIEQLHKAHQALSECFAEIGTIETLESARETIRDARLEISSRHVMGISVPMIEDVEMKRDALARGYGLHTTSSALDESAREFELALKLLIRYAELEASAFAIAKELEKTRRRVNALEYILIPRLERTIKFISMRLDEMERENFTRLKRIKAILEERR
ncbi:MAG: V-type ATP synthase subunit D [Hadesarchaea archaeon]|nr:MAG: V-type ATP synthase subunit D [Hadesarchaea archaeon]HDI12910.1 V-type ATP synthase subunit D [Hadesarchaea archaeon]